MHPTTLIRLLAIPYQGNVYHNGKGGYTPAVNPPSSSKGKRSVAGLHFHSGFTGFDPQSWPHVIKPGVDCASGCSQGPLSFRALVRQRCFHSRQRTAYIACWPRSRVAERGCLQSGKRAPLLSLLHRSCHGGAPTPTCYALRVASTLRRASRPEPDS